MKKLSLTLAMVSLLLITVSVNAQTKTGIDYFSGKWKMLMKGLPDGDTKMVFILANKDGKLAGAVQDTSGNEIATISSTEVSETKATVYFSAGGYDISVLMEKKDEDNVTGNLMSMFDVEGVRVKEEK
ncbi:MAG: hypothetical protein MUE32_04015 [Bacteroidales bacterium]|nr:hypothetical protein [Bacteroidales bacterium]